VAVAFALLSLVFAGLSDVVFKRYSSEPRSRGVYIMGMGAVWTVLQLAIVLVSGDPIRLDRQTIDFGVAAGLLVSLANLLLIETLAHVDVGLASTIYRLNTIVVVALAVGLLGEQLTAVKVIGVMLGIAAIVVLYERRPAQGVRRVLQAYFWLVIVAALLRASFGIACKAAVLRGVDLQILLLVNAPVWIVVGGAYALLREPGFRLTGAKLRYSVLSGVLICAIANFLMLALQRGDASIVVPIANMSFLVALIISIETGMEHFTRRKLIAMALTVAAIIVLSRA
jgi:drug/metabolite transporter (DMT)-like permease